MDRRCYEELLDERKNMELTYEERIAQLQDQHAEVRHTRFFVFVLSSLSSLVSDYFMLKQADTITYTDNLCPRKF